MQKDKKLLFGHQNYDYAHSDKYLFKSCHKLREEDKFGRTHTCYYQYKVSSTIPTQDEEPAKQKKSDKKKSKKQTAAADDDLPF